MLWPRICPVCREELPERGNRRVYVPWKRGFRLVHAGKCFDAIDAQGVLELDRKAVFDPVRLARMRAIVRAITRRYPPLGDAERLAVARVAKLLGREDERAELVDERRECVRRVARLLARLDQVDGARAAEDRSEHRLLADDELVDNRSQLGQLAHAREVSGQARTEETTWATL